VKAISASAMTISERESRKAGRRGDLDFKIRRTLGDNVGDDARRREARKPNKPSRLPAFLPIAKIDKALAMRDRRLTVADGLVIKRGLRRR
jgi:hypothetical protein